MKNIILTITALFTFGLSFGQTNYLIEYDKPTDKLIFSSKTMAGKKQVKKVIKNLPKLEEGDVVTVHVKNYNPFLYYVDISSSELIEQSGTSAENSGAMSMLNMITGGLNPISSFLGSLGDVEDMFSRGDEGAMEEESALPPKQVANENEFELFEADKNIIGVLINKYYKSLENYNSLKQKIYEEDLHVNVDIVISTLEKDVLKKFNNPINQVNQLYASAKLHALKSGIRDHEIRASFERFEKEVNDFKRLAEDPTNDFNKSDISNLIQALKDAKFDTKQSFEISADESRSFTIDEGSVLTGMVYQINFYDIKEVRKEPAANKLRVL